ncbi:hypothetical protein A2U01_0097668, partial [Trifolium medium]|nr:hypothetical protein [Trifolium medium]
MDNNPREEYLDEMTRVSFSLSRVLSSISDL